MKKLKRLSGVLAILMICSLFTGVGSIKSFAATTQTTVTNDTMPNAKAISTNCSISGTINDGTDNDWYKFTISGDSSQKIAIENTIYFYKLEMEIYNEDASEIYSTTQYCDHATGVSIESNEFYLDPGTYYVRYKAVYCHYGEQGKYNLNIKGTKIKNKDLTNNKSFSSAQNLNLNSSVKGVLSREDIKNNYADYFKIEVPKDGQVTINISYDNKIGKLALYNNKYKKIDSWELEDNVDNGLYDQVTYFLEKGTYYIWISSYGSYNSNSSGQYNLKVNYKDVKSTEKVNNSLVKDAQSIDLNKNYTGMIADLADFKDQDFYTFTLTRKETVTLNYKGYVRNAEVYLIDSNMNFKGKFNPSINNDLGYSRINESFDLSPGKYYIKIVRSYYNYTGIYNLSVKKAPEPFRGSIETPKNNATISGKTTIKGWYLYGNPIKKIEVFVDGKLQGQATRGNRSDIKKAYPGYDVSKAGFSYSLDTKKLSNGKHTIKVKATGSDGKVHTTTRTVIIKNTVLPFKSSVESVKNNQTIKGKTTIKGWYLYGKSIKKVEVLVDGKVQGQAARGNRADIKKTYKSYDTTKAGFSYSLDTNKLSNGKHTIKVKATGSDGKTNVITRTVTVKNTVLPFKSSIESIKNNQTLKGNVKIKGWYLYGNLCGKSIKKIEVLVDNKVQGQAVRGNRADLKKKYKGYDTTKAGFSYTLNTKKLKNGKHTIKIKATGTDGKTNVITRTITVKN